MNKVLAERKNYNEYNDNMKAKSARHRKMVSTITIRSKKRIGDNSVDRKINSDKKKYKSPNEKSQKYKTIDAESKIIESYGNKFAKNSTIKSSILKKICI